MKQITVYLAGGSELIVPASDADLKTLIDAIPVGESLTITIPVGDGKIHINSSQIVAIMETPIPEILDESAMVDV